MFSPLIDKLINALRCLPGVGPKSAQRMAFSLLEKNRNNGLLLANVLQQALTLIAHCELCRTFSETPTCGICANTKRQGDLLCIVESPADVLAIEQISRYRGLYFVLMGHLSPLDGIGPQELGIDQLHQRLQQAPIPVREIILATNPTVEGEATAHYLASVLRRYAIKCSRIAHGVPLGGELEYIDAETLARAIIARTDVTWETESP